MLWGCGWLYTKKTKELCLKDPYDKEWVRWDFGYLLIET